MRSIGLLLLFSARLCAQGTDMTSSSISEAVLAFPTFARGTAPGSAGGHYRIAGTNVPVTCGGVEVNPGDYVVGDEDGVAVAPKGSAPEVFAAAKKWQSDKQALLPLIERSGSYLKALQEQKAAERP